METPNVGGAVWTILGKGMRLKRWSFIPITFFKLRCSSVFFASLYFNGQSMRCTEKAGFISQEVFWKGFIKMVFCRRLFPICKDPRGKSISPSFYWFTITSIFVSASFLFLKAGIMKKASTRFLKLNSFLSPSEFHRETTCPKELIELYRFPVVASFNVSK